MKKLTFAVVAVLALAACNVEEEAKKTVSAVKGAAGDKAADASFRAANQAVSQVNQAVNAAAAGSPGAGIPNVQPETKKQAQITISASGYRPQAAASTNTGFEGPVAGPDGTDGWYTQTYSYTDYGNNESSFELYIKADPAQDLASSWPKSVKKLQYAWRGVSGYYDGYQWDSEFTVYSENRIGGTWSFKVVAPKDENSYAKYYVGSSYSGEFDLGGAALGDDNFHEQDISGQSIKIVYDYTNFSRYQLHFESRYDRQNSATPLDTAVVSDWFGAWSWAATANQVLTFGDNSWTTEGPFSYDTLWYWGMGKDPADFTEEPAYAEDTTPPASIWADPSANKTDAPSPGLYYWSKGSVKAESDYKSVYNFGATDSTVTGTCSGTATSLTYRGGKKCVKTVNDCAKVWEAVFPYCYEGQ